MRFLSPYWSNLISFLHLIKIYFGWFNYWLFSVIFLEVKQQYSEYLCMNWLAIETDFHSPFVLQLINSLSLSGCMCRSLPFWHFATQFLLTRKYTYFTTEWRKIWSIRGVKKKIKIGNRKKLSWKSLTGIIEFWYKRASTWYFIKFYVLVFYFQSGNASHSETLILNPEPWNHQNRIFPI